MAKLRAFFYILFRSITSPEYYRDVINTQPGLSVKYFATLAVLLSFIVSLGVTVQLVGPIRQESNRIIEEVAAIYPEDLEITLREGVVSVNRPQPYIIEAPEVLTENDESNIENLVVFQSDGTINDVDTYKTLLLVNDRNLLIRTNERIEVYPLAEFPDMEITKQTILRVGEIAKTWARYIPLVVFLVVLGIYLAYFLIIRTLLLFIMAGIFMMIGKAKSLTLPYGKYYQIGLHAITLPIIIESLSVALDLPIPVPLWFFVLNLLIGVIVIFSLADSGLANAPEQPE